MSFAAYSNYYYIQLSANHPWTTRTTSPSTSSPWTSYRVRPLSPIRTRTTTNKTPESITTNPTIAHLATTPLTSHLTHLRTTYVDPYIIHPISAFLTLTTSNTPDLLSILLLVLILFLSLKILDYTRRLVMFWVGFAVKLMFWGVVLSVGWWIYEVGVERAGREVGWVLGVGRGFVEEFWRGVEEGGMRDL